MADSQKRTLIVQEPRVVTRGGGKPYQTPRRPRLDWLLYYPAVDQEQTTTIRFVTHQRKCPRKYRGRKFRGQRYHGTTSVEHGSTILRVVHLKRGWHLAHQIFIRTTDPRIPAELTRGWRWDFTWYQTLRGICWEKQAYQITKGRYGGQYPRLNSTAGQELLSYDLDALRLSLDLQDPALEPGSYLAVLQYVAWYSFFGREALRGD